MAPDASSLHPTGLSSLLAPTTPDALEFWDSIKRKGASKVRAWLPSSEAELDLRRRAGAGPARLRPPARASVGRVRDSRVAGLAQRGRGAARRPDPCWHLVAHAAVSPPCPARTARAAAELLPPRTCRQLPSAWSQPDASPPDYL